MQKPNNDCSIIFVKIHFGRSSLANHRLRGKGPRNQAIFVFSRLEMKKFGIDLSNCLTGERLDQSVAEKLDQVVSEESDQPVLEESD